MPGPGYQGEPRSFSRRCLLLSWRLLFYETENNVYVDPLKIISFGWFCSQSISLFYFISKIYFLEMGAPTLTIYLDICFSFPGSCRRDAMDIATDAISSPPLVTVFHFNSWR